MPSDSTSVHLFSQQLPAAVPRPGVRRAKECWWPVSCWGRKWSQCGVGWDVTTAQVALVIDKLNFLMYSFVLNGTGRVLHFLCYFQHRGCPQYLKPLVNLVGCGLFSGIFEELESHIKWYWVWKHISRSYLFTKPVRSNRRSYQLWSE